MKRVLVYALLLLVGCRNHRPPAPTAEQAQQLNDAEEMLNDTAANAQGPADRSTGPSSSND
jgi:uncharacterized protein YcfL